MTLHTDPPMQIACFTIYPEQAPSVYQRAFAYGEYWKEQNIHLTVKSFMLPGFYNSRKRSGPIAFIIKVIWMMVCSIRFIPVLFQLSKYSVVIIHREVFPSGRPWIERLIIKASRYSVYDLDDAIWFPPSTQTNQRALLWYDDRIKQIMSTCSHIVVGNEFIAEYARKYNKHVTIIPTPYDDLQPDISGRVSRKGEVVIVWIGNLGNAEYLGELVPVIEELSRIHRILLRVIGGSDIAAIDFGQIPVELCKWEREKERQWLLDADIGIMPLYDRDYEKGKCAFKIIQYFSAGLPVVASPVGMNQSVIINGSNGFLAGDIADWKQALGTLITSPRLRLKLGDCAYETFLNNYTRTKNGECWVKIFRHIPPQSAKY